jgi:hypothetical protein
MARKLRIQYPGAIYHVMSRGDRREAIFEDDEDRQRLLKTLTEACQKTGWQVQALPWELPSQRTMPLGLDCGAAQPGQQWASGAVAAAGRRELARCPR